MLNKDIVFSLDLCGQAL